MNESWTAFADGEPMLDALIWLAKQNHKRGDPVIWGTYIRENQNHGWTHWALASPPEDFPPPPKAKSQRELDEEAFRRWVAPFAVSPSIQRCFLGGAQHERDEIRVLVEQAAQDDDAVAIYLRKEDWAALKQRLGMEEQP